MIRNCHLSSGTWLVHVLNVQEHDSTLTCKQGRDSSRSISLHSWAGLRAKTCMVRTPFQKAAFWKMSGEMCCQTWAILFQTHFSKIIAAIGGLCRGWGVSFYFISGNHTDLAVGSGKDLVTPLKNKSLFYLNTVSFQKEQHSKDLPSWSDYWDYSEAFTLTRWLLTSRTI